MPLSLNNNKLTWITSEVKREDRGPVPGRRGKIHLDARPTGYGKTTEAISKLTQEYPDPIEIKVMESTIRGRGLDPNVYPPMTANYYIAPNNNTKSRVFSAIKGEKGILKAKDSRIFLELKNSKAESALDKVYRKFKEGGKPIVVGVFGKNTMFYTFLVERELYRMGISHRSQVFLDDFVPNMAMTVIPVTRINRETGKLETLMDEGAYTYYHKEATRLLVKREEYGISLEALAEDQYEFLKELVSSASRFLLEWDEPIYLTGERHGSYVWDAKRLKEMLLHGDKVYVTSPEEVWATIRLLEWMTMGSKMALIITPNKPRASRALSAEKEEHAEQLLRTIAYMELLLMARGNGWVKKILDEVSNGKTVRLSDVQANTLIVHSMVSAGMDVHVINGTAVLEGGGYFHHNGFGYVATPQTDEHGRFEGWHLTKIISDNDKTLEVDPEGGRKDVTITLDGVTGFPTLEEGVRRFMSRTGMEVYSVRASLEDSMIAPISSIRNIIIPRERESYAPVVYQDLEDRRARILTGEEPVKVIRDFSGFRERVKGLTTMTLVRNLHILARSCKLQEEYEMLNEVMESQRRLQEDVKDSLGEVSLLNAYAIILLAEVLRRYVYWEEEERYRLVMDPRLIKLVSQVPVFLAGVDELKRDYEIIRRFVPSRTIAQANRGRSDKAVKMMPKEYIVNGQKVLGDLGAFVIWLTAVDPLYEQSDEFKYLVGLSEINQTLGRFVLRGPDTAQWIGAFIYLGGGTSNFTIKAITSIIHATREVEGEGDKVRVYVADSYNDAVKNGTVVARLGLTPEDRIALEEAERRKKWLESAQPEQVLTPEQARLIDQIIEEMEAKGVENITFEDGMRLLKAFEELDAQQRVLSDEWYTDPDFDFKPKMVSVKQLQEASIPRSYEEMKAEQERLKRLKKLREKSYVKALRMALEENYGISTSITNPEELKRLLKALDDTGVVPPEFRNRVWDSAGEDNPHILGTFEG